jgi:hypothetical protein
MRQAWAVWASLAAAACVLGLAPNTGAEVVQRAGLRVVFDANLTPSALPRSGRAPVDVAMGGKISTVNGAEPSQLREITISINRYGRLAPGLLPTCRIEQIQPATTEGALEACRRSLVGRGSFTADVLLPEQAPFPSQGNVYAFNGTYHGRPAILAHVYGTKPAPTSYTLPFVVRKAKGTFGTVLSASLPSVTSEWGYVTGLNLKLTGGTGRGRDYLTASCPAPRGFPGAVFPLARTAFSFASGAKLSATLVRNCKARG